MLCPPEASTVLFHSRGFFITRFPLVSHSLSGLKVLNRLPKEAKTAIVAVTALLSNQHRCLLLGLLDLGGVHRGWSLAPRGVHQPLNDFGLARDRLEIGPSGAQRRAV